MYRQIWQWHRRLQSGPTSSLWGMRRIKFCSKGRSHECCWLSRILWSGLCSDTRWFMRLLFRFRISRELTQEDYSDSALGSKPLPCRKVLPSDLEKLCLPLAGITNIGNTIFTGSSVSPHKVCSCTQGLWSKNRPSECFAAGWSPTDKICATLCKINRMLKTSVRVISLLYESKNSQCLRMISTLMSHCTSWFLFYQVQVPL